MVLAAGKLHQSKLQQEHLGMARSAPSTLFLHGGPGFSAELERRRFGKELAVHWWDQPTIKADTPAPFDVLVQAAQRELERLVSLRAAPVALLASSFGARIACALLARAPDLIHSAVILGGVVELRPAYVRLGLAVARMRSDTGLAAAANEAARRQTRDAYWEVLARMAAVPCFHDVYWSPAAPEQRAAMSRLALERALFDPETVRAVVNDVLFAPPPSLTGPHPPVRVVMGRHDPTFEDADVDVWRQALPRASIELVDSGHFPHLELPPAAWMPVP
jgi:pimeloyl-ACP methyl ester carboxylesterase